MSDDERIEKTATDGNECRARGLFCEQRAAADRFTGRIFSFLLPIQLAGTVLLAYFFNRDAAAGPFAAVMADRAILLAGLSFSALGFAAVMLFREWRFSRYIVGCCQMLMSGVLIQVTDGRLETHFHIFGSLALLSCYRDWRLLIVGSGITIVDHFVRAQTFSGHDGLPVDHHDWFLVEHLGWLFFANVFLIIATRQNVAAMWRAAEHSASLESSEERYRTVLAQMTESVFLVDPETFRVIDCNDAFLALIGCRDVAEATSLTAFDFDGGDRDEILRLREVVMKEGKSLSTIRRYQRRDGELIYVELTGRLINYHKSKAFCINARDVTERKRADVELQRLALVARKTQNAVVITDTEGRVQWVNDGFTRMTGYGFDEIVGCKPGAMLQGEKTDLETVFAIRSALKKRIPFEGEIYNYAKDGRGYWLSLSIMPINSRRGELEGFIAVEMDITERKAMEEKLKSAFDELEHRIEERTAELVKMNEQMRAEVQERKRAETELGAAQQFLRKVIDDLPSLVFVKDVEGRFVLVNRALARIFGTRPEKMIGKTYADFNSNPEEVARYDADDRHVIENLEEMVVHEEKLTDVHGNIHWLQTVKRPLIGDEGVENIIGIATDLTERKILESQLRHSQKLESIGQLAAGIAHEINTPTQYVGDNTRFIRDAFDDIQTVLNEYGDFLEQAREDRVTKESIARVAGEIAKADLEYLTEEVPRAIQQSLEGVGRIAKIVQSMKDFAHPGSSEKAAADLNKAIESTITVARNEWKYVAEMETAFDSTLPPVPCLLGEINQVVLNMIINASHAIADVVGDGSKGKGTITVTTTRVNDDWAEIRIGDTGTGIPPAVQPRIFDPFFTTKEVGKGTGQGLAISHTVVVDKHHGKLSFQSEPGKGTTFIIRLPLKEHEAAGKR